VGGAVLSRILLVVDNSNVYVPTMKIFGPDARFSYERFEKRFFGDDYFVAKQMTGSTPPAVDTFWDKMKRDGYEVHTCERKSNYNGGSREKGVDTAIVTRATECIINSRPDVLALISGDLDMKPLVEMARKYSCTVNLWTFHESSSSALEKECDNIHYIDDYVEELIYCKDRQGNKESLTERAERKAREAQIEREKQEQMAFEEQERKALEKQKRLVHKEQERKALEKQEQLACEIRARMAREKQDRIAHEKKIGYEIKIEKRKKAVRWVLGGIGVAVTDLITAFGWESVKKK